ncbi:hypothetical protein IQ22_03311 [Pseudomonas duriflava]|uniref:Uncharacterized protein n=1 Tax=Pseudomonas duriflava TaxID=459528 RepID=A0A562Q701_9PSED|nr:hypothetical protein [Pseudomonas duriflava]TWI52541.1 hypothetical protein IQ22_03311 [Pseudomonas duriflava]
MSRYELLQTAFTNQERETNEYWSDLSDKAQQIRDGFEAYLELPQRTFHDSDHAEKSYVRLGRPEDDQFIETHSTDLPGINSAIHFGIGVILEKAADIFPKRLVWIRLSIRKKGGIYYVRSEDAAVDEEVAESDKELDFSDVYKGLFRCLERFLSARP